MKNNEWNVPSDYFEKNKRALLPVRKFPTGKWILALAAACFVGIGLFMWKGEDQTQEVAKVQVESQNEKQYENEGKRGEEEVREGKNEKHNENENEDEGKRGEEKVREGKNEKHNENEDEGKRGEEKVREGKYEKQNENENEGKRGEEKVREGKRKEEIAEELKEIPREELVAYLLEENSDFIENID
jgi:hypothetical protein